jgi:hypothetical protein
LSQSISPKLFPFSFALALIFNVNALSEVAMERFVVVDQLRIRDVLQLPLSSDMSFRRKTWV